MPAAISLDQYLDALLSLPSLVDPAVSRDGRWVAWTWFRAGPTADVYAAPTDGSQPPIRLTETSENARLVGWTPDSRAVLVEQDEGGDERMQLFRVALEAPLRLEPLTAPHPNYFLRGGELHPNGRWLVYGANVDESEREIEPTWIYRRDLVTGERRILARPQKPGSLAPKLSPSGDHVLYPRMDLHPAGRQYWLVDIEGLGDREILNFGAEVKVSASWFPDGERVLVLAETPTHRKLGVWRPADGSLRWLLDDAARNLEQAFVPFGSDQIVAVEVRRARPRASLIDPETVAETPLPELQGNLVPLAPTPDGAWVGLYYSARQPNDLVRFDPRDGDPQRFASLTRVWERTPLTPDALAPAEDFTWRAGDGREIHGWLYRAEQRPDRGTIVFVHGGPTSHSQDQINPQIQYFVRAAYNVLDPNYRGSTGYGIAFREAIRDEGWGGAEQDDIRAGIAALLDAGIARPGAVGMTGTSYGGYSTWHAITHSPLELVAAAAPICGMTDLVVDYETTRPDLRPYSEEMMGGSPAQAPERYRERSPIHFVGAIRGRLLIVQGERDPNVTPENVRTVRAALDAAGIPYELLTFADEGHGISKPRNQQRLFRRLAEFFDFSGAGA
jgi:dipeptidyl aminopeptidase/acylaminoacyl peptidase